MTSVRIVLPREPGAEAGASESSLEGPGCVWVLERPECRLESMGSHKEELNLGLSIKTDPYHTKWFQMREEAFWIESRQAKRVM